MPVIYIVLSTPSVGANNPLALAPDRVTIRIKANKASRWHDVREKRLDTPGNTILVNCLSYSHSKLAVGLNIEFARRTEYSNQRFKVSYNNESPSK